MNKRQLQAARRARDEGRMRDLLADIQGTVDTPMDTRVPAREPKLKGTKGRVAPNYRPGGPGGYSK